MKSKSLEIKNLSKEDLESLQKKDPFLYYSIPGKPTSTKLHSIAISIGVHTQILAPMTGIRRAAMFQKTIDHSDVTALCQAQVTCQIDELQGSKTPRKKNEITRRTAISFEADPTALMEEFLRSEFSDGAVLNKDT